MIFVQETIATLQEKLFDLISDVFLTFFLTIFHMMGWEFPILVNGF